jgi:hypothetical protein
MRGSFSGAVPARFCGLVLVILPNEELLVVPGSPRLVWFYNGLPHGVARANYISPAVEAAVAWPVPVDGAGACAARIMTAVRGKL